MYRKIRCPRNRSFKEFRNFWRRRAIIVHLLLPLAGDCKVQEFKEDTQNARIVDKNWEEWKTVVVAAHNIPNVWSKFPQGHLKLKLSDVHVSRFAVGVKSRSFQSEEL